MQKGNEEEAMTKQSPALFKQLSNHLQSDEGEDLKKKIKVKCSSVLSWSQRFVSGSDAS